jgi:ring-1,2-phenylacetyl-CoA epoxidase subunit PaaE
MSTAPRKASVSQKDGSQKAIQLRIVLDGKPYEMSMDPDEHVLDVALQHGLDLPYSCKAGVCCTCRAKVLEGKVEMSKNFTLEPWEMAQGFVLSCQARPTTASVVVSFDER